MLDRITVRGFKSLRDVTVELGRLSVFFGPNASGKSNLLDAVRFLAASGLERSLADALERGSRGIPAEAFTFPAGGLAALLSVDEAKFEVEALTTPPMAADYRLEYMLSVGARPRTGDVYTLSERLQKLRGTSLAKSGRPRIQSDAHGVTVRKRHESGRPFQESARANHTAVSIPSYTGELFPEIGALRAEFFGWRLYYLEPRAAMRQASPPQIVDDIGIHGQDLPAFLFRLKNSAEHRRSYDAIVRMVRQVIVGVESLDVQLNEQRAEINLSIRQHGVEFSSRVVSEGTLRVVALAAMALNPNPVRLIGLEEPENGVHPARLQHILDLLRYLALDRGVQVLVNTHSPLFVSRALALQREQPEMVKVLSVRSDAGSTSIRPLEVGELWEESAVAELLRSDEDAKFQAVLMRGLLDV